MKRSPTHPGAILREDVFPALGISRGEFAKHLDISAEVLDSIFSEKDAITGELALRLGVFLGNDFQLWMAMQSKYDLWNKGLRV